MSNTYFLKIALLVIAAWSAGFGLCGCTQPKKAPAETAKPTRIAAAGSVDIYCTWDAARNGRLLALPLDVRNRGDDRDSLLVIERSKNGYSIRKVIDGGLFASWSPGGDQLAFSREVTREVAVGIRGSSIGLYSLEDSSLVSLANGYVDRNQVWRHDNKAVAFTRWKFGDILKGQSNTGWVMIVPILGRAFGKAQSICRMQTGLLPETLQWRPLRNEIAYIGLGTLKDKSNAPTKSNDIYLLDVAKGSVERLTYTGDVERYSLAWSPDSKRIAFATGIAKFKTLEVLDVAARKRQVVLKAFDIRDRKLQNITNIRWSPDGKHIVFDASKYEPGNITDIGVLEWPSRKFAWLTHDLRSKAPRWSSDGNILFIRNGIEVWRMMSNGSNSKKLYTVSK